MQRLQGMHCVIERCRRFKVIVPHPGADLHIGAVVVPEQETGAEPVPIVQAVVVPDLPDALRIHGSDELSFPGIILNAGRLPVTTNHVVIKSCHEVESIAVQVVPRRFVDWP